MVEREKCSYGPTLIKPNANQKDYFPIVIGHVLLTYCTPQAILLELKRYNAKNVEMMMYNAILHTA